MAYKGKPKAKPEPLITPEEELLIDPIVIQRDVTVDRITEYYYDLVEAFKNGDPRVKATDYIKALTEIGRINKLYEVAEIFPEEISFVFKNDKPKLNDSNDECSRT